MGKIWTTQFKNAPLKSNEIEKTYLLKHNHEYVTKEKQTDFLTELCYLFQIEANYIQ